MSRFFYVTTPIYYVNAEPHIGHTYTTVVVDTLARYHRLAGEPTFFLTGTDEHGEKVLQAAAERGVPPEQIATTLSGKYQSTWQAIGISFDRFIRTTEQQHREVVQRILQQVYDAGDIFFQEYEGLYCVGCERFLTDRDLVDGLCRDHERPPEKQSETNYFFRMTRYFDWLVEYIEQHPDFIRPERYRNEVLAMLREEVGLGDLCISRPKSRLEWGIELPFDADYVCYVWFDALINYLTGIGYPDDPDFARRWDGVEHLVGKDILKAHAIFWPTMLRSIGLAPYRHLTVHGHWNVDDRKVSKSLGNMVSPLIMRDRYGFDAFRYFLLRDMVFGLDANFTEEALVARINADLANNLGNLVSRTLNMTSRFTGGSVPEPDSRADGPEETRVREAAEALPARLDGYVRKRELQRALESIFRFVDEVNRYLEVRAPWHAAKDPDASGAVRTTLFTCCEALRIVALLLAPFLPETAPRILDRLGIPDALDGAQLPAAVRWGGIPVGSPTTQGEPLFPRAELPSES